MTTILDQIVVRSRQTVAESKDRLPLDELKRRIRDLATAKPFRSSLADPSGIGIIAEIKKASPSAGVIRTDFDPVRIAQIYQSAGANCLSVLTDEPFFQGHIDYLQAVRQAVDLPLLRKDFIIDSYQIWEARWAGADAVLLIAEILPGDQLAEFLGLARECGIEALVELHDIEHLDRVVASGAGLIGVNNRDLRTFVTRIDHTLEFAQRIPPDRWLVSESGIRTHADVDRLKKAGVRAVLVGESLMRSADIALALRSLRG